MSEADRDATEAFYDGRIIVAQDFGVTIRVVLPICLDTGETVPFEVWVVVHQDDMGVPGTELEVGDWTGQTFRGLLLNAVEPWPEVYDARVVCAGQPGQPLPRIVSTEHAVLHRVLTEKWPRATIAVQPSA